MGQTIGLALLGLLAGGVLFVIGQQAIIRARPDFDVVFTAGAAMRATAAAVGMAMLAAIVPARRLAALEPASAFRGS